MLISKNFSKHDRVILTDGCNYHGCIFDDCEIVGDLAALKDISFTDCNFRGRSSSWFTEQMDASGGLLMTVDVRSGEIIPGPASDHDPSFPGHLRRN